MFHFREPVNKLLHKRRLTQKELVANYDISQSWLTSLMLEDGVKSVSLGRLKVLADALGVRLWILVREASE